MDYSQFGAMLPELIILGLFLIVFIFDTFSGDNSKRFLTPLTTVLFGLATIAIWLIPASNESIFGGMYIDTNACKAMKAILNIGVFIVFLQSANMRQPKPFYRQFGMWKSRRKGIRRTLNGRIYYEN